jgi:predicted O-linked N-acetylglucosamine transferase (SPINDLY family)
MTWEEILAENDHDCAAIVKNLEQVVKANSQTDSNYFYLGLSYVFLQQDENAAFTWNLGIANSATPCLFITDLCKILEKESFKQEGLRSYQVAFNIRQALRNLLPNDFHNLVQIFYLSLHLNKVKSSSLQDLNLFEVIKLSFSKANFEAELMQILQSVLSSPLSADEKIEFVAFAISYVKDKEEFINIIVSFAPQFGIIDGLRLIALCLKLDQKNLNAFSTHIRFLLADKQYEVAIKDAEKFLFANQNNLFNKVVASHLLLGALLNSGGKWENADLVFNNHKLLILEVVNQGATDIPMTPLSFILLSSFFTTYFCDTPRSSRFVQNQVSRLFQDNMQLYKPKEVQSYLDHQLIRINQLQDKKLKIGFLSNTLRRHSVGWLARFLIENMDRNAFELFLYLPDPNFKEDFLQDWYVERMDKVFRAKKEFVGSHLLIADEINYDQINILIDMESITSAACCQILALKPAPLQITWLGWDASGIPAMDYYIADPYVLPENAQEYYSEKIWRLPHTYLAIDGFEAAVPTLTRSQLDIPADAVIYFSSQKSDKRHPKTVGLQMEILKQVPNSYFLIKGLGSQEAIKNYFYELAEAEGVSGDRLRFLPMTNNESEHRGNLNLADVVLDTYPYTGATTTMEVLWMGIPLVTRVGEQFVSRNSYAMMMNAGITEGIAHTPEDYVKWGVRFGTEPDLRKEVAWKLKKSRKTSPLWNSKQFTKDMEKALKQMWEIYNG